MTDTAFNIAAISKWQTNTVSAIIKHFPRNMKILYNIVDKNVRCNSCT